jgi:hypothetical protein
MALDCWSNVAVDSADVFVFITITNSFRESPREGHCFYATSMLRLADLYVGARRLFLPVVYGHRMPLLLDSSAEARRT